MATTTKKTTTSSTSKTTAKTQVKSNEEKIKATPIVEKTIDEVEPVIVKEKKVFTDSDYILCRSVWSCGLNVVSQS